MTRYCVPAIAFDPLLRSRYCVLTRYCVRFLQLEGGGTFDFDALPRFSQSVEGLFTPTTGNPIFVSLKSFINVVNIGGLLKSIRRNANTIIDAGRTPAILYAEPTKFGAQQLADFARNGPLFKNIMQEGVFKRIILRARDGIVEITPTSIVVKSL